MDAVFMKRFDTFRVVAAAELDDPNDLPGFINDERIGQLFPTAGVRQHVFAAPGIGPLRGRFSKSKPYAGDTQVMRSLQCVLEIASLNATENLRRLLRSNPSRAWPGWTMSPPLLATIGNLSEIRGRFAGLPTRKWTLDWQG